MMIPVIGQRSGFRSDALFASEKGTSGGYNERRRYARCAIDQPTSVTLTAAGRDYPCALADVSLCGARISLGQGAEVIPNGTVRLTHAEAGAIEAETIWHAGGTAGIAFEEPQRELERALQCISMTLHPDKPMQQH